MRGKCYLCEKDYAKGAMLRHIKSCKGKKEYFDSESEINNSFIISINAKHSKDFWLIIRMDKNASLVELDQFIRDVWVECCGHLSCFRINGTTYDREFEECIFAEARDMDVNIKNVVAIDENFTYDYDFGSTTELKLKIAGEMPSGIRNKRIEILARNEVPKYQCEKCHGEGEYFNPYEGDMLCEKCLDKLPEDEQEYYDFIDKECNSPRAGVCGYCGTNDDENGYLPDKLTEIDHEIKVVVNKEGNDGFQEEDKGFEFGEMFKDLMSQFDDQLDKLYKRLHKPIQDDIKMEEYLSRLLKDDIRVIGSNFGLNLPSKLKKADMIEKIMEGYNEGIIHSLKNLPYRIVEIISELKDGSQQKIENNIDPLEVISLSISGIIIIGKNKDEFVVRMSNEAKERLKNFNFKELLKNNKEENEIVRLIDGLLGLYGFINVDDLKKVLSVYTKVELSSSRILELVDKSDFTMGFGNIICDVEVIDIAKLKDEQEKREGIEYYIYPKKTVLNDGEDEDLNHSKDIIDYLLQNYDITTDEAEECCMVLCQDFRRGLPLQSVINEFMRSFQFEDIREINLIMEKLMKLYNKTGQWILKGNSPNNISKEDDKKNKIGRNDPCPCGSGKKYKKCCGKK